MAKIVFIIIAVLGLVVLYKRINSFRNKEKATDELSQLILQKAASISFYTSLYLWVFISYMSSNLSFETDQLINYGIIGMAILFVIVWIVIKSVITVKKI